MKHEGTTQAEGQSAIFNKYTLPASRGKPGPQAHALRLSCSGLVAQFGRPSQWRQPLSRPCEGGLALFFEIFFQGCAGSATKRRK